MTRVIHTGDTHIGYRQYHSPERRDDFLSAFDRVVDDAIEDDVDAVVHAGDLFHDRRPGLADLHGTISVLRKLRRADIPFLAIVGNHESTRGDQWLDLFETLGLATRLGSDPVVVGDTAFYGLDHVPLSKRDDLEYEFDSHEQEHAALVAHGLFQPFEFGNWDAEVVLTESAVDFDAMLLGDNHQPGKERVADTWVTYCGSTERASASERDDRGYNIVQFDGETTITRRGIPTRDFAFISVGLADDEGIDRVREAIREYDLDDSVALVTLSGEGEDITPARVEEFALEEGALVARVNDRREIEAEAGDLSVSFADPDDAVRERVREMGLSETAHDLDEIVRASKVADSNVRAAVEEHVGDRIEEGIAAFEPAPDEAGDEISGDQASDGDTASDDDTASNDEPAAETREASESETEAESVPEIPSEEGPAVPSETESAGAATEADGSGEPDKQASSENTDGGEPADTDGQISMEDFL